MGEAPAPGCAGSGIVRGQDILSSSLLQPRVGVGRSGPREPGRRDGLGQRVGPPCGCPREPDLAPGSHRLSGEAGVGG